MSFLNISKVSDAGERCWGVVVLNENSMAILRSEKGVTKGEANAIAKTLKFEGPGASVVEEEKPGDANRPAWVIEKTDGGWLARFTPVSLTSFDVILKPENAAGPPEIAVEAVEGIKICLAKADIKWDPPEADPAYDAKETDQTDIVGLPGSGPQLPTAMKQKLDQLFNWTLAQIPVLESPVLLVLDYSPSVGEPPLSIAFDYGGGP